MADPTESKAPAAGSFLSLSTPSEVRALLARFPALSAETVPLDLERADGRVLFDDVASPEDHPAFARATMDGFAVRAADTFGCSDGLPAYLKISGTVPMGGAFDAPGGVASDAAVEISTGGMMPPGADAVVMLEYTQRAAASPTIEVTRPVAPGDNVIQTGDDVRRGAAVVRAGARLRPGELAILAACGVRQVRVHRAPIVAILSTGDELVGRDTLVPGPGQVRDVNSLALAAQVRRAGGVPLERGIVGDRRDELLRATERALAESDLVLLSGGSSAGSRDLTVEVLSALGPPGVLVHGIAVAPGKPTIVARVGDKPLFGMPGYPVSSLVIFELFVAPLIGRLAGERSLREPFGRSVRARLSRAVASKPGREDYVRVTLRQDGETRVAEPVRGGTASLSSVAGADGVVRLGIAEEGRAAGSEVEVLLWT